MKKIIHIGTTFFCLLAAFVIMPAYANSIPVEPPTQLLVGAGTGNPEDIIGNIIAWMIRITAILSIIAITWAGIQMVLAVGEEDKITKSRSMIIYAFIGLIIAGLAYAIVQIVTNIDLNSFF